MPGIANTGIAELDNYIKDVSMPLLKDLFVTREDINLVTVLEGITNKMPLTGMVVTDLLQPSLRDGEVNLKGDVTPVIRYLEPMAGKVDFPFVFEKFRNQYLVAQRQAGARENVDEGFQPFFQWVIDNCLLTKLIDNMAYVQWRGTGVVTVNRLLVETCVGFKKQFDDAITANVISAGNNNLFTGAAITAANAYDMIEAFVDAIPNLLKEETNIIYCAPQIARWFNRDKNTTFGSGLADARNMSFQMNDYDTTVVGVKALTGTTDLYLTQKENMFTGMETATDEESWTIFKKERSQVFLADVVLSNNFADARKVAVRRTV